MTSSFRPSDRLRGLQGASLKDLKKANSITKVKYYDKPAQDIAPACQVDTVQQASKKPLRKQVRNRDKERRADRNAKEGNYDIDMQEYD